MINPCSTTNYLIIKFKMSLKLLVLYTERFSVAYNVTCCTRNVNLQLSMRRDATATAARANRRLIRLTIVNIVA